MCGEDRELSIRLEEGYNDHDELHDRDESCPLLPFVRKPTHRPPRLLQGLRMEDLGVVRLSPSL